MQSRPEKAVVLVLLGPTVQSDSLGQLVKIGNCGRLALQNIDNWIDLLGDENSLKLSDENIENSQTLNEVVLNTECKVIYVLSNCMQNIESLLELSLTQHWHISVILSEILPIADQRLHEIAPKQSYQFIDCKEIKKAEFSVFYVDFERNYTRKDWLEGEKDLKEIGGSGVILCEQHHIELLTRLGLKGKYGA